MCHTPCRGEKKRPNCTVHVSHSSLRCYSDLETYTYCFPQRRIYHLHLTTSSYSVIIAPNVSISLIPAWAQFHRSGDSFLAPPLFFNNRVIHYLFQDSAAPHRASSKHTSIKKTKNKRKKLDNLHHSFVRSSLDHHRIASPPCLKYTTTQISTPPRYKTQIPTSLT